MGMKPKQGIDEPDGAILLDFLLQTLQTGLFQIDSKLTVDK